MQKQELKSLIADGRYRPEPAEVAGAMLRRRAVRALLIGLPAASDGDGRPNGAARLDRDGKAPLISADRSRSPSAAPRQAA